MNTHMVASRVAVSSSFAADVRSALVAVLLCGLLVACGGESTEPDPATAPRSNVPALRSSAVDSLVADTSQPVPVPDLTLQTLDGGSIALAEQPGKVLLLNFWATWCPPCRKEIPDLIKLQNDLGPEGLQVIGVAFDQEGAEVVRPFVEEYGISYPIVPDTTQSLESHLGPIYALPTTVVVGPDGLIQHRVVGLFPVDDMRARLREMLAAGTSSSTRDTSDDSERAPSPKRDGV